MKRNILYLLLSFLGMSSYAQISFVKGYLINNNGQKTECLIKDVDWKNNPTEFNYKLSENADFKTAAIDSVQEFGILDKTIYRRFKGKIDRSSELEDYISSSRNPVYNEETLFLKVLVEGKAKLYSYIDGNLIRFFSQVDSSNIDQLVFKSYKTAENTIEQNQAYKQQLFVSLMCSQFSRSYFERLKYSQSELTKCFVEYNKYNNLEYTDFEKKQNRDVFNLTFRPAGCITYFELYDYSLGSKIKKFNNELGGRVGIEAEFIMPFNKNKWSVIFAPTFQSYKSEKMIGSTIVFTDYTFANVDYKSIEFSIGIRYYSFLNDNSKVFFDVSGIYNYAINSKVTLDHFRNLIVRPRPSLSFGLGYKYKNKYSIELKYGMKHDILAFNQEWISKFSVLSLGIGYSIF